MPRGRRDTSDSLDGATPRCRKSEKTDESTFVGGSGQSRGRPPGLDLKSHANRLKKKLQSNDDSDAVNVSNLRPLGLKTSRNRRKLHTPGCPVNSGITVESAVEHDRPEARSRSAMYIGDVLEEKKRELQNVVIDFKSKLQTPRRLSSASGETSTPEPTAELDATQVSGFRHGLQNVSRYGRKSSSYIAGPTYNSANYGVAVVATKTEPVEIVPAKELSEVQLEVTSPQKSARVEENAVSSSAHEADVSSYVSIEQPALLKSPRYRRTTNSWNVEGQESSNCAAEDIEDVTPIKKGPASPRMSFV